MAPAAGRRTTRRPPATLPRLILLGLTVSLLGGAIPGAVALGETARLPTTSTSWSGVQNDSSSSTSSTDSSLCPSTGPVILGITWNCVAVLDLTELALILLSIGIVAYVFRDSDRAELPGESAKVPMTADEQAAYQEARRQGMPYEPPKRSQEDQP